MTFGKLFYLLQYLLNTQDVQCSKAIQGQERKEIKRKEEMPYRAAGLICISSQLNVNVHILPWNCFPLLKPEFHYMPVFVKDFSSLFLFSFFRLYLCLAGFILQMYFIKGPIIKHNHFYINYNFKNGFLNLFLNVH